MANLKKIEGCYIAPISYLNWIPDSATRHLCLAHLLEDDRYVSFYKKKKEKGDTIIMDNSAFELGAGIDTNALIEKVVKSGLIPDYIVAPDYPKEDWKKTYESLISFIDVLKNSELSDVKVMGVPQSKYGDVTGFLTSLFLMIENPDVKMIGMSILGIPNAFQEKTGTSDISFNRIFASNYIKNNTKLLDNLRDDLQFHYLGASSIREFIIQRAIGIIDSFDTSSAIWHGINGVKFDDTATGLINGKIDLPVDFDIKYNNNQEMEDCIMHNINFIEQTILG